MKTGSKTGTNTGDKAMQTPFDMQAAISQIALESSVYGRFGAIVRNAYGADGVGTDCAHAAFKPLAWPVFVTTTTTYTPNTPASDHAARPSEGPPRS